MVIYKIRNKVNGKVYIGKTVRPSASIRWNDHLCAANVSSPRLPLHRAVKKYGPGNFTLKLLHSRIRTEERLNLLEKRYIRKFKSNESRHGYNLTSGGDGGDAHKGHRHSKEARRRIGLGNRGKIIPMSVRTRISKSLLGKRKSPEHCRHIKENHGHGMRGKRQSSEAKRKIRLSMLGNRYALGYKHSLTARRNMSQGQKRRRASENA